MNWRDLPVNHQAYIPGKLHLIAARRAHPWKDDSILRMDGNAKEHAQSLRERRHQKPGVSASQRPLFALSFQTHDSAPGGYDFKKRAVAARYRAILQKSHERIGSDDEHPGECCQGWISSPPRGSWNRRDSRLMARLWRVDDHRSHRHDLFRRVYRPASRRTRRLCALHLPEEGSFSSAFPSRRPDSPTTFTLVLRSMRSSVGRWSRKLR